MAFTTFPLVGPYAPETLMGDLNTNFADAQSQLNALDTRLDAAEPQLVSLDSRVDVLEATPAGSSGWFKNKVINGCMRVDQRNNAASQTFTAGAALAYSVDRWYGYCTGANITGQQVSVSGTRRYRFTGAASNTGFGFGHRIEAASSFDLAGDSATLQVKLSSTTLTSIGWAVYYANTDDTFGTLASPTRTLISSGTFTINTTEAVKTATITVPGAATTGLEIVLTGGALLGSQTVTIGDVQLEKGTSATTFECRPIGLEFDLCQRYYLNAPLGSFVINASGAFGSTCFPSRMRAVPNMTFSSSSGTVTLGQATVVGFHANGNATSGAGYTASAEL